MTAFWKTCIEESLSNLGGEADLMDIYEAVEILDYLGERDKETSPHQGRPRYQHSIRACASRMVKSGELMRVARGRFRLPDRESPTSSISA